MDKFSIAIELLTEAREEKKRLESYSADYERLPSYSDPDYYEKLLALDKKYGRTPRKSVINDNIKTARRLLLDEYV